MLVVPFRCQHIPGDPDLEQNARRRPELLWRHKRSDCAAPRPPGNGIVPARTTLYVEIKFFGRHTRDWIRDGGRNANGDLPSVLLAANAAALGGLNAAKNT